MVMSGGQRLVGPGGQVIVAAPGQQLVRTSGGQILVQPQQPQAQQTVTVAQPRPGNLRIHIISALGDQELKQGQQGLH